ncbi:hypothetical protein ABIB73_004017 [Bradyrhizobium sp. F1.4.3]|uniref:hypothetical protein n=1 Tax=Bradyrhizobium sp. F1.4.3 TaxID=3156356 RepID=UPI00339B5437
MVKKAGLNIQVKYAASPGSENLALTFSRLQAEFRGNRNVTIGIMFHWERAAQLAGRRAIATPDSWWSSSAHEMMINICVSEGSPMRLVLPYFGICLCASLAAWLSFTLLY